MIQNLNPVTFQKFGSLLPDRDKKPYPADNTLLLTAGIVYLIGELYLLSRYFRK